MRKQKKVFTLTTIRRRSVDRQSVVSSASLFKKKSSLIERDETADFGKLSHSHTVAQFCVKCQLLAYCKMCCLGCRISVSNPPGRIGYLEYSNQRYWG